MSQSEVTVQLLELMSERMEILLTEMAEIQLALLNLGIIEPLLHSRQSELRFVAMENEQQSKTVMMETPSMQMVVTQHAQPRPAMPESVLNLLFAAQSEVTA